MREFLHHLQTILVAYGPPGVIVLAAFDSMGIPLPAAVDAMLIGIASGSVDRPALAYLSAFLAVAGSTAGNWVLFQAARHGRRLFTKAEPPPGKRRRFQEWFREYGLLTIFVPAVVPFLPLPLKVFVISAGALHTPASRFLAVIVTARVIRYFGITWLGLQLGADAQGFLRRNSWTLAGVGLALAWALALVMRYAARRKESEV